LGAFDDAGASAADFCGVDSAGEVRSLYVRPELTRQGLGTRLLSHALEQARQAGQARFTAWATPFSLPVFDRAGLRLVGTVREPFCGVSFERYRVEGA
jgi:GNAT superfamily N-acetyltransferase